jgi:esterase/lipase superfamily enzyme
VTLSFPVRLIVCVLAAVVLAGCATKARELMPTPLLYQQPGGKPLFAPGTPRNTDIDLLYITDRAEPTAEEQALGLPYGQQRARRIAFGSATVRLVPGLTWDELITQSTLGKRTREVNLELGPVRQLGAFPEEPYRIERLPDGHLTRTAATLEAHDAATDALHTEIRRRLAESKSKEVVIYVHGFNETFATAASTAAELCHFLGRDPVCTFFTWPASSTGNFLISYTNTTESAAYTVAHLRKTLRLIAAEPGVERVHLLAHSRGTAVALDAVNLLFTESIAAGKEPIESFRFGELVLFSPDVDLDIAAQRITGFISDPDLISVWPSRRLPRALGGRLTIYSSPEDRALLVSKILFRSRSRLGQLTAADLTPAAQAYLAEIGRIDLITYEGKRTDAFGHSYFTTNPEVSSDLVQLLRFGKRLGEPGRRLVRTGPVTWEFPLEVTKAAKETVQAR